MIALRNAYSYIRMSTDTQLKGDSLRRQFEASAKYARDHGLNLIEHMQDIGVSGWKGQNAKIGVLGAFIHALENGDIPANSVLLVENLDRLSRNQILEALQQFLNILNHDIEIVTLSDQQRYTKQTLANNGTMFISIGAMLRANEESEIKSKRISAAWENKRKTAADRPLTSLCPAWLRLSKETQTFEQIPDKVEVVKKIFAMCINTSGIYAIARHLNANKIPVFGRAKFWHESYISKILANHAVIGQFQPKKRVNGQACSAGDVIANYFPPIISEQDFYLARAALNERVNGASGRKGANFSNLFSGLIYCGSCGGRMRLKNRGKDNTKSFICSRQAASSTCNMPEWHLDVVESTILRHLHDIDFSTLDGEELKSHRKMLNDEISALQLSIKQANDEIEKQENFIRRNALSVEAEKSFTIALNRQHQELASKNARYVKAIEEREACDETERQIGSKQLQKLLGELRARQNDYDYRATFNHALKMAVSKIVLIKQPFQFNPWEYNDDSIEVINFRNEKISRSKLSLEAVQKRKKFADYCDSLARHIEIHYKNGAVRYIQVGSSLWYLNKPPVFKHKSTHPPILSQN